MGRSGDSDRERRVRHLRDQRRRLYRQSLSRNAASATERRARKRNHNQTICLLCYEGVAFDGLFLNCEMTTNDYE